MYLCNNHCLINYYCSMINLILITKKLKIMIHYYPHYSLRLSLSLKNWYQTRYQMLSIIHRPLSGGSGSKYMYNEKTIFGSLSLIGLIAFVVKNKIVQLHRLGCVKPSQHIIESAKKSSYRIDVSHHKIWRGIKLPTLCRIWNELFGKT